MGFNSLDVEFVIHMYSTFTQIQLQERTIKHKNIPN
jgi:hypothetical protein